MLEAYRQALNALEAGLPRPPRIMAGFDGFVDLIARPVRRMDGDSPQYFGTIREFGEYLIGKSEQSCSIELRKVTEKAGGNMPIFAAAMAALGAAVDCIGALGYPDRSPAFPIGEGVHVQSVSDPGVCTALEFRDGKVMLSQNDDIDRLDYRRLTARLPAGSLHRALAGADMAAFLNWSEMPGGTSIWQGILREILPDIGGERTRRLLVDISDCSRKSAEEIEEMLALLREFTRYFQVALSVNQNEARGLCAVLGVPTSSPEAMGQGLLRQTGVDGLAVHLLDGAYAADGAGGGFVPGRQVPAPRLSTGGGDNFNAGLSLGLLCGMGLQAAAALGNAASGFYVSHARSPERRELAAYIRQLYLTDLEECV